MRKVTTVAKLLSKIKTDLVATQPAFTYSELTIETLEQGVKYVQCQQ